MDKAAEKRFGVVLADAVARAKANKRRLLAGVAVFCTENIPNGGETYKSIVESNSSKQIHHATYLTYQQDNYPST